MDDDRLGQLLAALALSAADRVRAATAGASDLEGAGPAALVHLQAYPDGSVNDLAAVVGLTQTGAVRLVERLVAAGYVERRRGRDRRTHALALTPAGQDAAGRVLARRAEAVAPIVAALTAAQRAALGAPLEAMVAALAGDRPAALSVCRLCDRSACCRGRGCPLDHTVEDAA